MLRILLILCITSLLFSCCKNPLGITSNEDKGVKEILKVYGGSCKYSIGFNNATETGNKKYFELELSNSEVIEHMASIPELPGSGITYTFYKELKEEKKKYTHIKSVLLFNNGNQQDFEYSVKELEMVTTKMNIAFAIAKLIKDKRFEDIKPFLSDSSATLRYNKNNFIRDLSKAENAISAVKEFVPLGFWFVKEENGRSILHISGQILREREASAFSVDFDLAEKGDKVIIFNYKV